MQSLQSGCCTALKDGGTRYDELGVFLPLEHFADRLERHVETATKIVYGE